MSLLLIQLAENPMLLPLYQDLFDADGSEICLKPASYHVGARSRHELHDSG